MTGTCAICSETDIPIDDNSFCENCYNEYMYRESQEKAQRNADIKTAITIIERGRL